MNQKPTLPRVTHDMIVDVLRVLGLSGGDAIFVHSSLSHFGWVEGGPETVCRAVLDAVAPDGTVVMPAFSFRLKDVPNAVLDLENEPSCVGRISEVFRRQFATHRSRHFMHSVSAAGPKAGYFTEGHAPDAFDAVSAFRRLVDVGGYILLLGVDYNACTFFHAIEYAMPVPYIVMAPRPDAWVRLRGGKLVPADCRVHQSTMPYDFNRIAALLDAEKLTRTATCGNAILRLFPAADVFRRVLAELRRDSFALVAKGRALHIPFKVDTEESGR